MSEPLPASVELDEHPWRLRFDAARDWVWRLLPGAVSRHVPPTVVGYCVINLFTFSTDMVLLTLASAVLGLPTGVSVSIGYVVALGLAYVLNRALNFESHAPVGGEMVRYVVVVLVNYTCLVLGISKGLSHLRVPLQLARLAAATAEAVFMYCMMRWVVFRRA